MEFKLIRFRKYEILTLGSIIIRNETLTIIWRSFGSIEYYLDLNNIFKKFHFWVVRRQVDDFACVFLHPTLVSI